MKILTTIICVVVGMFALSYAAFPIYNLFCAVTGYGGTTQKADSAPVQTGERIITVRFNADKDPKLPWKFLPKQDQVTVKTGQQALTHYIAESKQENASTGMAVFNVTPAKAGKYFNKIECFCFNEQTLSSNERVEMPVTFFIDPAIEEDPNMDDVKTVTLSYTFFLVEGKETSELN